MSKLVENALERVQKSQWRLDRGILEIMDAVLLFTNFSGQKNQWGNASKNFNIVIPADLKEFFENNLGFHVNIHKYPGKAEGTDDDPCVYYINVKVNMESEYPPAVTLYTNKQVTNPDGSFSIKKGRVSLEDATVGCLDRTEMERADCKLNVKESKANPGNAVFYLRQLNVIQTIVPDFNGIYEDWDDPVEPNPEILAENEELLK